MKTSETLSELATALAAAQSEMKTVVKGDTAKIPLKDGGSYSYKYADLADIAEQCFPLLNKHGLAVVQGISGQERGVSIETMLLHTSGEYLSESLFMPCEMGDARAIGSAATYGRRYGLALVGVVTGEDDGGAAANKSAEVPRVVDQATGEVIEGVCPIHGVPWELRPAGISKKTGKPYREFWTCPDFDCKEKPPKASPPTPATAIPLPVEGETTEPPISFEDTVNAGTGAQCEDCGAELNAERMKYLGTDLGQQICGGKNLCFTCQSKAAKARAKASEAD